MRVQIYDERLKKVRSFEAEPSYIPRCGNGLHQFAQPGMCACKVFAVEKDEPAKRTVK